MRGGGGRGCFHISAFVGEKVVGDGEVVRLVTRASRTNGRSSFDLGAFVVRFGVFLWGWENGADGGGGFSPSG